MRDLTGEELEKAFELVGIAAHRGCELGRVLAFGGLERADLELQPVAEAIDSPQHTYRVALGEAAVEEVDIAPHPAFDAPARIDELDGEVRRACFRVAAAPSSRPRKRPRRPGPARALRSRTRVESRAADGCYGPPTLPELKPFRALRYDKERAGPLEDLVAPPYDVIAPEERERYLERSPYNVVHLTLPDSEEEAGRTFRDWRDQGVLAEEMPAFWALSQDYVGPDGVARTRTGLVGSLRLEPYEKGSVLPHERTHRGPKEGRLRLLRETRAELEPIFLLYEGDAPFAVPDREPDIEVDGARLWRLEDDSLGEAFADRRLLIADGHHRYETALAYHEEAGTPESGYMMVVLVSTSDPGLMIFPTHRVVQASTDRTQRTTTCRVHLMT